MRSVIRLKLVALLALLVTVGITAYSTLPHTQQIRVKAATTTSLYATGLLDHLSSEFSRNYPNVRVEFIAVGTGAALRMAEKGDVCIVLAHAPELEKQYLGEGVIVDGNIFAFNYFVIAGPEEDPANASEATDVIDAFKRIYSAGESGEASFISRGDGSGTHARELKIWGRAGVYPDGVAWYKDCGCGMSEALIMANELRSYTLSDLGTYLELKKAGRIRNLEIIYINEEDALTINVYSVYVVSNCAGYERRYAELFANFIYANQALIETFGIDKYGEPLFHPAAGKESEIRRVWELLASG